MKKLLLTAASLFLLQAAFAQVAISNPSSNPDPSAMLDVKSTTKGMLMPRMTSAQRTAIASPATGLMVYETTTNAVMIYNGTAWTQLGSGGGSSEWPVNGTHIYNGNTGNVGIGISSPLSKFHVEGNTLIRGGNLTVDDDFGTIYFKKSNTNRAYIQLRNADNDMQLGTLGFNTTGNLFLHTQGITRLTIDAAGNVGIGTTIPTEKLDVNGDIRSRSRIDADGVIEGAGLSSSGVLYVNSTSLLQGAVTGNSSATFGSTITSNTAMAINDAAGIFTFRTGSTDKAYIQLDGNDMRLGTFASNDLGNFIVRVNGYNTLNVTPTANVGIGTGTPSAKLHVAGKIFANASGEAIKLDGVNPNIGFYQNGTYRSFISQSGSNLFLGVNGGSMQLDAVQIAIGGIVPAASGYKLTVTGKAICEELKVKLSGSWPDYVFKKDYKLLSLSELEKFVQKNHHLPNIPKGSDLEENGMEVGDMQKRMMEKVEELTLYIIDLQKQIDQLKAEAKKQ